MPLKFGPIGVRIHVDTIALDRSGDMLYLGAVTSNKLYRLPVSALHAAIRKDPHAEEISGLPVPELKPLSCVGKPLSDGASSDESGAVWLTAIADSALVVVRGERQEGDVTVCHVSKVIQVF